MKRRTIGWLARQAGVGVETIRYYQRRGLLPTPPREGPSGAESGIRTYDDDQVRALNFIRAAQSAGFTLEQIGELMALDAGTDRARASALAERQIAALDAKIAQLQEAREALAKLVQDCRSATDGPCPILDAFDKPSSAGDGADTAGRNRYSQRR